MFLYNTVNYFFFKKNLSKRILILKKILNYIYFIFISMWLKKLENIYLRLI